MTDVQSEERVPVAPPRKLPVVVTPLTMIDKAISKGVTPESLEKLIALQERWERGEARKAFNNDLAAAKSKIGPILKNRLAEFDAKGQRTSYQWEDLAAISEIVDPILAEHGIHVTFRTPKNDSNLITITCILSHRLGHVEEGATLSAAPDQTGAKNSVQAVGSTATYLQRYTERLTLGLSTAKDDDAKGSSADPGDPKNKPITAEQYQELQALLEQCHQSEDALLKAIGIGDPRRTMHDLIVREYERAKTLMVNSLAEAKKKREDARKFLGESDGTAQR